MEWPIVRDELHYLFLTAFYSYSFKYLEIFFNFFCFLSLIVLFFFFLFPWTAGSGSFCGSSGSDCSLFISVSVYSSLYYLFFCSYHFFLFFLFLIPQFLRFSSFFINILFSLNNFGHLIFISFKSNIFLYCFISWINCKLEVW